MLRSIWLDIIESVDSISWEVSEQALGGISLGLGIVVEDKPSDFHIRNTLQNKSISRAVHFQDFYRNLRGIYT